MSLRTEGLLKRERIEVTLENLVEYYATSNQVKGCSKKTSTGIRSNLRNFIHFFEKRGHSLELLGTRRSLSLLGYQILN